MAKDKRDSKGTGADEEYEFVPADFDEDGFIHKEMVSFRTTSILFLWGIIAAAVSWLLFGLVDGAKVGFLIGLGVAAVFGFALKWLYPRLKVDIKHFGRREWLGTGFLFFFTWLAFFILAINPPVSDYAPPRVDVHAAPAVQQAGSDVVLDAFYEDNTRVASHALTVRGPAGDVPLADEDLGRGHHRYVATALPAGIYVVEARATDLRGHANNVTLRFTVVETALGVYLPDGALLDAPNDEVFVQVGAGIPACTSKKHESPCVRTVALDLLGGARVNLEYNAAKGGWGATANHAGWSAGANNFTVQAELIGSYVGGNTFVPGGTLTSGPHTLNVSAPIGTYEPKVLAQPAAPVRSVPGIELPLVAVGLLGLVLLRRR